MTHSFEGRKLIVVGGSSGMGQQTAADVVAAGGSAVIVGRNPDRVDETVMTLSANGKAWGISADLTDRDQVSEVQQRLAAEHADASLLVNAAGIFSPRTFVDVDGPFYDSYLELDRAIFFLTQTVVRGMVEAGNQKLVDALTRAIPFGRLAAPHEIAAAVAFFASPDADFITGQVLSVSGGLTMVG